MSIPTSSVLPTASFCPTPWIIFEANFRCVISFLNIINLSLKNMWFEKNPAISFNDTNLLLANLEYLISVPNFSDCLVTMCMCTSMCVCVRVSMSVYMCTHVHVYVCACTQVYVCVCVRASACMHVCVHVHMCMCAHACARVRVHVSVCTYACICVYASVYTWFIGIRMQTGSI